jgi:hypothetical protein
MFIPSYKAHQPYSPSYLSFTLPLLINRFLNITDMYKINPFTQSRLKVAIVLSLVLLLELVKLTGRFKYLMTIFIDK